MPLLHPAALFALLATPGSLFNLHPTPRSLSGPHGSYFGYSLDFYGSSTQRTEGLLVGAPKAKDGVVFLCGLNGEGCKEQLSASDSIPKVEFRSGQMFGSTVRALNGSMLACAPLYRWRTVNNEEERETVGTCLLAVQNFSKLAEYSPCRSRVGGVVGEGYCQAGFSSDFTNDGRVVLGAPGSFNWQGQVISASQQAILAVKPGFLQQVVQGQSQTTERNSTKDNSYMGYAVTVGEFTGDSIQEYIAGTPKGSTLLGHVVILNSTDMNVLLKVTGDQFASSFGHAVLVTDINNDGMDDLLVGSPLHMKRGVDGQSHEIGRVSLYLQLSPLHLATPQILLGPEEFGRFGSSFAALGDLDQDGYNDVAVGMPFGGENHEGVVLVYNGQPDGLKPKPSQILNAHPSLAATSGFGFSLRGATDIDANGYPDIIVGAFGADKAFIYKACPVLSVGAQLRISPAMINPENKTCSLPGSSALLSCFTVEYCLLLKGKNLPETVGLQVEINLDHLRDRERVRRAVFKDDRSSRLLMNLTLAPGQLMHCASLHAVLKEEGEFRDKLSPIVIHLNFSLGDSVPSNVSKVVLQPVLNHSVPRIVDTQTRIMLDCGEDNICIPDLHLTGHLAGTKMYLGDDKPVNLTLSCANVGEGAYEAELLVWLPQQAEYIGVVRGENIFTPSCVYRMENMSKLVACDLGNPMKPGVNVTVGLKFTFPGLSHGNTSISFSARIHSSNPNHGESQLLQLYSSVLVLAQLELRGKSYPSKLTLDDKEWPHTPELRWLEEIGPELDLVIELYNGGPSWVDSALLHVEVPVRHGHQHFLYPMAMKTNGPLKCSSNFSFNHHQLPARLTTLIPAADHPKSSVPVYYREKHQQQDIPDILNCSWSPCLHITCQVGRLSKQESAVVTLHSRLWASSFLEEKRSLLALHTVAHFQVTKMPPARLLEGVFAGRVLVETVVATHLVQDVPYWVLFLAVLVGLLLLALLIYSLWKVGFFKRNQHYKEELEIETQEACLKVKENGMGD
uniref:integrin alpha-8-like n=1 Tax=Myxine glutinosa TaxID=7769 RepID=UPI00358E5CB3